jgi:hypothetical protein
MSRCTGHPLPLSTGARRASLRPVSPLLQRVEPLSTFPPLHLLRRTRATKIERCHLLNISGDVLSTSWCWSSPEGTELPPPQLSIASIWSRPHYRLPHSVLQDLPRATIDLQSTAAALEHRRTIRLHVAPPRGEPRCPTLLPGILPLTPSSS